MKPISLTLHGAIDYLAVVIFAAAPAVIGLSGWPAALSYALAGVHLLMTLLTDFPAGVIKVIPIVLHQWVERIVGPVLIILAFDKTRLKAMMKVWIENKVLKIVEKPDAKRMPRRFVEVGAWAT